MIRQQLLFGPSVTNVYNKKRKWEEWEPEIGDYVDPHPEMTAYMNQCPPTRDVTGLPLDYFHPLSFAPDLSTRPTRLKHVLERAAKLKWEDIDPWIQEHLHSKPRSCYVLPAEAIPVQLYKLDKLNAFPRDVEIKFIEEWHSPDGSVNINHCYFVRNELGEYTCKHWMSVSELYHAFFPHFNARKQATKTFQSAEWQERHNPGSRYHHLKDCQTVDDIVVSYSSGSERGTALHLSIEKFLNEEECCSITPENEDIMEKFKKWWMSKGRYVIAFRTEMNVFSRELMLAGQIDFVGYDPVTRTMVVWDWKRVNKMNFESMNKFNKDADRPILTGYGPCKEVTDSNYFHYAIQVNIYKWLLENYYGLFVASMVLVFMHPDYEVSPIAVPVPDMQPLVVEMLATRKVCLDHELAHASVGVGA